MRTQMPSRDRRSWSPWLPLLLLILLLGTTSARAAEQSVSQHATLSFHLHNGLLTVRATDTPLRLVLAEISRLSGAHVVWGTDPGERQVSVDFTALPLDEGLRRVLDRYNFMLVYVTQEQTSTLAQIWISSAIDAGSILKTSPPVATTPVAPESGEAWDDTLGTFAQRDELALSAALVEEESKTAGEEDEE
jgi:hypothetical protein